MLFGGCNLVHNVTSPPTQTSKSTAENVRSPPELAEMCERLLLDVKHDVSTSLCQPHILPLEILPDRVRGQITSYETRERGRTLLCSPQVITRMLSSKGRGDDVLKRTLRVKSRHSTTRNYPSTLIGRQHSSKANKPASSVLTQKSDAQRK